MTLMSDNTNLDILKNISVSIYKNMKNWNVSNLLYETSMSHNCHNYDYLREQKTDS